VDGGDGSRGSPKGWLKKAANYKFPKNASGCLHGVLKDIIQYSGYWPNGCAGRH
tara:strand:+ start:347 stop:508 length:162 start_codon:yes stop_codon:yes gene_type:complete